MSKSDPKHFITIDGHKFRRSHVRWALAILINEPDWCPQIQATLGQLGGGLGFYDSLIPESIIKAGYGSNARYFCRPFMNEARGKRKYTKRKNEFLSLFNALRGQQEKWYERLIKGKHRTDQDDAR